MLFLQLILGVIEMHLHTLKNFAHNLNNFTLIYLPRSTFIINRVLS